jgi:hypothetical protein
MQRCGLKLCAEPLSLRAGVGPGHRTERHDPFTVEFGPDDAYDIPPGHDGTSCPGVGGPKQAVVK